MTAAGHENQAMVVGLVASHGERLRRFLVRRVRNSADIPDLVQEIFLRMMRIPDHDAIRSPEAYLFTVARHVVQQHTLRQSATPVSVELQDVIAESRACAAADPELEVSAQQCLAALTRALETLPPRARAAFLMHRRDGVTIEEIGRRFGVSRPMAKKYLAKALLQIRQALEDTE
ncbi:MAG: RNA polymerase sigma factor [Steroidobacteraceae bacterium]